MENVQDNTTYEYEIDEVEDVKQFTVTQNGIPEIKGTDCNERHQLVKYNGMDLNYDNNGNLTHFTHDYVYNWKNQLVKVITGTGVNVEYKYDALGRRIVKKVKDPNSETVNRYVHDGYQVIEERDDSDQVLYRYSYGNGIDERIQIEKREKNQDGNYEWKSYFPIHDSIGNVTDLANDKGHIIESYNYSPYGEVTYRNAEGAPGIDNITIENGKIKIRFDRPVDLNSLIINFYIKVTQTPIIGEIGSYDMERGVLVTPSQLPENEGLNLTIKAPDEIGGTGEPVQLFSKDFIYQGEETKTLHDQGPPRVERIMYITNAFHIDFNEPIDPSSVGPTDNVEITYGSTTIKGSIEITGDNRIKFTPEEILSTSRSYGIDVKDIKDYAGKAIVLFHYDFELNTYEQLLFTYSILAENTRSAYGNNSLMHGRTYEPEVGLYYYRNRYYHPKLGRFLQQDPMGYEDSLNLYQAFGMNPVNNRDPFGLYTDFYWQAKEKKYKQKRPLGPQPGDEMTKAALVQHGKNTAHNFGLVAVAQVPVVGKPFVAGYAVRQVGEGYIGYVKQRWNNVSVMESGTSKFFKRASAPLMGLLDLIGITGGVRAVTDESLTGEESGKLLMNSYNQLSWTAIGGYYGIKHFREMKSRTADPFYDLAVYREIKGMPEAGSIYDAHTAARLEIGGETFYGHNAHKLAMNIKVNPQTRTHAEAHVFQQAKNAGIYSKKAKLIVDRDLCKSCGNLGGLGSLMRGIGVDKLIVVSPSGTYMITSSRPSVPQKID